MGPADSPAAVASVFIPGARRVIYQPGSEGIKVCHQYVRSVEVEGVFLQHQACADLVDIEEVHGQWRILPSCLLNPQQRTKIGIRARQPNGRARSPGVWRDVATIWVLTASSAVTTSSRLARCAPAAYSVSGRCALSWMCRCGQL
jgi:hypothetical protein